VRVEFVKEGVTVTGERVGERSVWWLAGQPDRHLFEDPARLRR
jgi:hypothetical protein